MASNVESNIWSSSDANGQTYKSILMQTLVHKDFINYQNHTWGHHALSISPILVIDDSLFYEGLYNELSKHAKQYAWMHEHERQMLKNKTKA